MSCPEAQDVNPVELQAAIVKACKVQPRLRIPHQDVFPPGNEKEQSEISMGMVFLYLSDCLMDLHGIQPLRQSLDHPCNSPRLLVNAKILWTVVCLRSTITRPMQREHINLSSLFVFASSFS